MGGSEPDDMKTDPSIYELQLPDVLTDRASLSLSLS